MKRKTTKKDDKEKVDLGKPRKTSYASRQQITGNKKNPWKQKDK